MALRQLTITLTQDDDLGFHRVLVQENCESPRGYSLSKDAAEAVMDHMQDVADYAHGAFLREHRAAVQTTLMRDMTDGFFTRLAALRNGGAE